MPENKAGARESFRGHALTREQRVVGHRAEDQPQSYRWHWENRGSLKYATERLGKLCVPYRFRRHDVHRPSKFDAVEEESERPHHVIQTPLIELLGYAGVIAGLALGLVDLQFAWLFFSVVVLYGMLLSVWAILLEEVSFRRYTQRVDVVRLLINAVAESFGYRQLTLLFRLRAFWKLARGYRGWGAMKREGFGVRTASGPATP